MRTIFGLIRLALVAGLFWSGLWLAGAELARGAITAWLAERRAEGWLAEAEPVKVTGYPARFELRLEVLDLADPDTGLAWAAPGLRLTSDAWDPLDLHLDWPTDQVIATPEGRVAFTTAGMGARLALAPDPALTLRAAAFELQEGALASTAGWRARLAEARLSAGRIEDRADRLALSFTAAEAEPSAPLLALLDPRGRLPRMIDRLEIEADVDFDAPWDIHAIDRRRPQPTRIDLSRLAARWGQLELMAAGDLAVDAEGRATGTLQLRAVNWREMLALGQDTGLIPPDLASTLETALALLAAATGRPETLEVPLIFTGGEMFLGPVPLGPAPRFGLR